MTTPENSSIGTPADFAWALGQFADTVAGIRFVAVVSGDGLLLTSATPRHLAAVSAAAYEEGSDSLGAAVNGILSLLKGISGLVGGGPLQHVHVSMKHALIMLGIIDDNAGIAVVAEPTTDLGDLGYELALFVRKFGHVLTPELRQGLRATATAVRPAHT